MNKDKGHTTIIAYHDPFVIVNGRRYRVTTSSYVRVCHLAARWGVKRHHLLDTDWLAVFWR